VCQCGIADGTKKGAETIHTKELSSTADEAENEPYTPLSSTRTESSARRSDPVEECGVTPQGGCSDSPEGT